MSLNDPIKFLYAYTRDDLDIFFGRDKETSALYEKVGQSKVVLLYGLSGTGKTSLINCGLENRFENNQRTFIYVRRGANILKSFRQAVETNAKSLIHPKIPLAEALEILFYDYFKSIIVVFDQFEELFISGDSDEWEPFIEEIAGILKSDLHVKFIFSIREEYLAHMDDFEEKIPIIFDHRLRLERMSRKTLEDEVITEIAAKGDIELENEKIPGMIFENIADRKGYVELPYLQVYLFKLTELMKENDKENGNKKEFTELLVKKAGKLEDVLGAFLEEQITKIAKEIAKDDRNKEKEVGNNQVAINYLLKQFITPEGTKKQLAKSEIKPYGNMTDGQLNEILNKLVSPSRIIKLDDGIYELSHDSLAKSIAGKWTKEEIELNDCIKFLKDAGNRFRKSNQKTHLSPQDLKYVQTYLDKMPVISKDERDLLDKSRRRQKYFQLLKAGIAIGLLCALIFGGNKIINDQFKKVIIQANLSINKAEWDKAIGIFDDANKRIIFIGKKQILEDSIYNCNFKKGKYEEYRKLVNSADTLFDKGTYRKAIQFYNQANNTGFDPKLADIIKLKTDAAISEYKKLAKLERDAGHLDLALVLLMEAYLIDTTRVEVSTEIKIWQLKAKPGKLTSAKAQLKSDTTLDSEIKKALEKLEVIPTE